MWERYLERARRSFQRGVEGGMTFHILIGDFKSIILAFTKDNDLINTVVESLSDEEVVAYTNIVCTLYTKLGRRKYILQLEIK